MQHGNNQYVIALNDEMNHKGECINDSCTHITIPHTVSQRVGFDVRYFAAYRFGKSFTQSGLLLVVPKCSFFNVGFG